MKERRGCNSTTEVAAKSDDQNLLSGEELYNVYIHVFQGKYLFPAY